MTDAAPPMPTGRPRIQTFDLFDTLVARRCGTGADLHKIMGRRVHNPDFPALRQSVEDRLWVAGNYTFADIYDALGYETGWPAVVLEQLMMLELALEWENLFPIAEIVARVRPGDLVVTDMYLPEPFLRHVLDEKCGLVDVGLHATNHGKYHGTVWPVLLEEYDIEYHCGDNRRSDVEIPRTFGILTQWTPRDGWTDAETHLRDCGLDVAAQAVRHARLTTPASERRAQLVQWGVNIPFLLVAAVALVRHARSVSADTILMCGRDCHLWVELVRMIGGDGLHTPTIHLIPSSRDLFTSGNTAYVAYFQSLRGARTIIADLSGTGRTPAHFIASVGAQRDTSVFLALRSTRVAAHMEMIAPARADVGISHLLLREGERFLFERFNASLEGRAIDMRFTGATFEAGRMAPELTHDVESTVRTMNNAFTAVLDEMRRHTPHVASMLGPSDDMLCRTASAIVDSADAYADVVAHIPE
jgi:hypothetical protein